MLQVKVLVVLLFFKYKVYGDTKSSDCESKESCSECLQQLGCMWCNQPRNFSTLSSHCALKSKAPKDWCSNNDLIAPESKHQILSDKPLRSNQEQSVQIRPQRLKLTLRKGEEYKFNFQYARAENYPVDLYYIMDLSASMEDHREKLAQLGDKLGKTMREKTSNFRLGFGSFVDKVALPFVSTVPSKLKSPCNLNKRGKNVKCDPPYSFKNHMSLTHNYEEFSRQVFKAKVSGNLDSPEGGFDAIMQAIVCKEQIGWRPQARHLLVFSTDAEFHIAGDGKLVGAVEVNDARCHLKNNEYPASAYLTYDYPSISQINYVAKENNINIVFAVAKKDVEESYKLLSENIENSNTGLLIDKSDNVIKLVLDNYNKIADSVSITTNATENVEVKIIPHCRTPKENGCQNISVGEVVDFTAIIKPISCSKSSSSIISIKPEAIDENILIELDVICNCSCENPGDKAFKVNAPECNGQGNLKCGICKCLPGRYGSQCECDGTNSFSADETSCKANASGTEICSGFGTCKCGKCECATRINPEERIYGKYCQCDNYSCNRENDKLCSGRGTCDCGKCYCQAGWVGSACECHNVTSTCIMPNDNKVCSGYGSCVCGKCECTDRHSGRYCQECPSCKNRCDELRHCVECQVFKEGKYNQNECKVRCTEYSIDTVDVIEDTSPSDEITQTCRIFDKEDCEIIFKYTYYENKDLIVVAQKKKVSCPVDVIAWIAGVISTIVLAGLLMLIIWKILTTLHDRREYAKFENERQKLKWHREENPLYKEATSTFQNPAYGLATNRASYLAKRT